MFKVVKKDEATSRKIADSKLARNFITKEISESISLATIEAVALNENELSEYNRIYYVLTGEMKLIFDKQEVTLLEDDVCFLEKGTTYTMQGTFKAIVINNPAFGK